ncbi:MULTISPECIES: hypothetical protein [unclassified Streptomyces]|uniref:hypothetical protein n=1 Tax=unclassified Streptomyces TaxID=2593676 RepID=UPI00382EFB87
MLTVLALVGGLFLTFNTNALGPEKVCHGRLSADNVQRPGRRRSGAVGSCCPRPVRRSPTRRLRVTGRWFGPGFRLGKVMGPKGQSVEERTSGDFDSAWFCDLSFTEDEGNGPFTGLAVVKDPELAASLKDRGVEKAVCGGEETYFLLDNVDYPWEPKERAATGFPSEKELSDLFATAAHGALDCS